MRELFFIRWLIPDFSSHPWTLFATIYLKVFLAHYAISEAIRWRGLQQDGRQAGNILCWEEYIPSTDSYLCLFSSTFISFLQLQFLVLCLRNSFPEKILEARLHLGRDYYADGASFSDFSSHPWSCQALCFHGLPACWQQYQQAGRKVHPAHYLQHFRQPRLVDLLACYSLKKIN